VGTEIEYSLAPMIAADDDCCRLGEGSAETVIGRVEGRRGGGECDGIRESGEEASRADGRAYEKSMGATKEASTISGGESFLANSLWATDFVLMKFSGRH